MGYLKTKHIHESCSPTNINYIVPNKNKIVPDVIGDLQTYLHEPLKEGLLMINLLAANENNDDSLALISEIKKILKMVLNNCDNILKCRLDITKHMINIKDNKVDVAESIWNSKLFIDISILVQKICGQKQINPSIEKVFLCIREIYNYSVSLSNNVDPKFAEWIVEKFLDENNSYNIISS
jgi:hypothetical protein